MGGLRRLGVLVIGLLVGCAAGVAPEPPPARRALYGVVNGAGLEYLDPAAFEGYASALAAHGFGGVRLALPWAVRCVGCPPGVNGYTLDPGAGSRGVAMLFERIAAARSHGLRVMVSIDWSGALESDPLHPGATRRLPGATADEVMWCRDARGIDAPLLRDGVRAVRFENPALRRRLLAFVDRLVGAVQARYPGEVEGFGFTFNTYGESELPPLADRLCDTSPDSLHAFRRWLRARYRSPEAVSTAWRRSTPFRSFEEIQILDGRPPPKPGEAPPAYLDFMAFREASLGGFLAEIAGHVHAQGGRAILQLGSVWDGLAVARGTVGFPRLARGYELLVVDDAPDYDHAFSMDYLGSNSPVPYGNEIDSICFVACASGDLSACCDPSTFDAKVDYALGAARLLEQAGETYRGGACFFDLANWEPFAGPAFRHLSDALARVEAESAAPVLRPVRQGRMWISERDFYLHHGQPEWLAQLLSKHAELATQGAAVDVQLILDLPVETFHLPQARLPTGETPARRPPRPIQRRPPPDSDPGGERPLPKRD